MGKLRAEFDVLATARLIPRFGFDNLDLDRPIYQLWFSVFVKNVANSRQKETDGQNAKLKIN